MTLDRCRVFFSDTNPQELTLHGSLSPRGCALVDRLEHSIGVPLPVLPALLRVTHPLLFISSVSVKHLSHLSLSSLLSFVSPLFSPLLLSLPSPLSLILSFSLLDLSDLDRWLYSQPPISTHLYNFPGWRPHRKSIRAVRNPACRAVPGREPAAPPHSVRPVRPVYRR